MERCYGCQVRPNSFGDRAAPHTRTDIVRRLILPHFGVRFAGLAYVRKIPEETTVLDCLPIVSYLTLHCLHAIGLTTQPGTMLVIRLQAHIGA